jgi:hypothetical protein
VFSKIFFWIIFIFNILLSVFIFFDEEPLFDFTDWNIIHIFFIVISLISIINENMIKSRYGQYVFKDKILLFSAFSYWFFLQNYMYIVVIGFCFHCLTPLEIEIFELVEVFSSMINWISFLWLFNLLLISFILFLILLINFCLNWENNFNIFIFFKLLISILLLVLIVSIWDFLFSSYTSNIFWNNFKNFYINSKSSLTYDNILFSVDQFDWHKDQSNNFVLRFEDLYFLSINLFMIFSFICCLIVWFFFIKNFFLEFYKNKEISNLFLSVCFTWFNNCCFLFFSNYMVVFLTGLRITLKILIELFGYLF